MLVDIVSSSREAGRIEMLVKKLLLWTMFDHHWEREIIFVRLTIESIITICSTNCCVIVNDYYYQLVINITNNNKLYYYYIILQNYIIFYCSTIP